MAAPKSVLTLNSNEIESIERFLAKGDADRANQMDSQKKARDALLASVPVPYLPFF